MRGNALVRILASHKKSWWDNQTMNINVDDAISDPLEGFQKINQDLS